MIKNAAHLTYRTGRRIVITLVGASVLVLGIVMIVTPGPALIVIPVGLAILAVEFVWARHGLRKLRVMISRRGAEHRGHRAEQHRESKPR
ncbi:MAG: PGPGW domain-containing protein [Proteobacteria bacterium]|nr:PGPGW domain-containing protein [Pseudomonadota bacterium]